MAFSVSYLRNPAADPGICKAIYLDQQFYEMIWLVCRSAEPPYQILREMACLRYKSPVLHIRSTELLRLNEELDRLAGVATHEQIAGLRAVCREAISQGVDLTISGDMYPEL